ncbi:MAG: hypothetical protein IBJ00_07470 [Alphaproteobacteria bacterium]|nr:hypothetical protein [Alphaproteobacteria bacterium]
MKLSKFILVSLGSCSILSFLPITTSKVWASAAQCKSRCGPSSRALYLDWCITNCDPAVLRAKGVTEDLIKQIEPLQQQAVVEKAAANGLPPAPPAPPLPGGQQIQPPAQGVGAPAVAAPRATEDLIAPVEALLLPMVAPLNRIPLGQRGFRDLCLDELYENGTNVNAVNGAAAGPLTQAELNNLKAALAQRIQGLERAFTAMFATFTVDNQARPPAVQPLGLIIKRMTQGHEGFEEFFNQWLGQEVQADGQAIPGPVRNYILGPRAVGGGLGLVNLQPVDGGNPALVPGGPLTPYEVARLIDMFANDAQE